MNSHSKSVEIVATMLPRKEITLKEMQDIVNEWSEDDEFDDEQENDMLPADGDVIRREVTCSSAPESESESDDGEIVIETDGSDIIDSSDDEGNSDID